MAGAGDVWTISTCLRDAGHVRENSQVITWSVIATSSYGDWHDLDTAWQAVLPNLMNLLSDGVDAEGAFYRRWLPTPMGAVSRKFPTAIAGGTSAQQLPLASCALVLRQSGSPSRNTWGRLYLPWLPVQYEDAAVPNQIVEINRLGIEQACYDLDAALQAGGTGSSWRTVTVSSRSLATPGVYATPVVRFTCMRNFRALAQRGRRDYRCPFEDHWLVIAPFESFARRRTDITNWSNNGSNLLHWRYWLDNGARGGDDGTVDPDWTQPGFDYSAWHNTNRRISPGYRFCPAVNGPGGVTWPTVAHNPNANDPPAYDSTDRQHYLNTTGGIPNTGSSLLNDGELDYYRCEFLVTNVPTVLSARLRINWLDGCAHYINGTEVWNNLGDSDASPPDCRAGEEIDILPYLNFGPDSNCWGVIHQPQGELGTSRRWYDRYIDHRPPDQDPYDSWWAGEIRIGGNAD